MVEYANVPPKDYPKIVEQDQPVKVSLDTIETIPSSLQKPLLSHDQNLLATTSYGTAQETEEDMVGPVTHKTSVETVTFLSQPIIEKQTTSTTTVESETSIFSKSLADELSLKEPLLGQVGTSVFDKPLELKEDWSKFVRYPTFQEARHDLLLRFKPGLSSNLSSKTWKQQRDEAKSFGSYSSDKGILERTREAIVAPFSSAGKAIGDKLERIELQRHIETGPSFDQAKIMLYNNLPHEEVSGPSLEKQSESGIMSKASSSISHSFQSLKDTAVNVEKSISHAVEHIQLESHIDHKGPSFNQARKELEKKLPHDYDIPEDKTLFEKAKETVSSIGHSIEKAYERMELQSHIETGPDFDHAKLIMEKKIRGEEVPEAPPLQSFFNWTKSYIGSAIHSIQNAAERIELQSHIESGPSFEVARQRLNAQLPTHPGREVSEEFPLERVELETHIERGPDFQEARIELASQLPRYPGREITSDHPAQRVVYADEDSAQPKIGSFDQEKGLFEKAKDYLSSAADSISHTIEKMEIQSHIEQGPDFQHARTMLEKKLPHDYEIEENKGLYERAKDTLSSVGTQFGKTVEKIQLQSHIEKGPDFETAKLQLEGKQPDSKTLYSSAKDAMGSLMKSVGETVERAELRWHIEKGPSFSTAQQQLSSELTSSDPDFKRDQLLRRKLFQDLPKPDPSWNKLSS